MDYSEMLSNIEEGCYVFSWQVKGYDCATSEISSPKFTVNFQVTEWHMELDLSKLQNVDSFIPFRLIRNENIGPHAVIFNVNISVELGENKSFSRKYEYSRKIFSKATGNSLEYQINVPHQPLEYKDKLNWLNSKNILIKVEFKSPTKERDEKYLHNNETLLELLKSLKSLRKGGLYHDLVLKISDKEFKLHKCILNARWPNLMSELNIKATSTEVEPDKPEEFIPPELMEPLLDYVYYGNMDFIYRLDKFKDGSKIFDYVRQYNLYRLNDKITQLSSNCSSNQFLQSYRTTVGLKFLNVTSAETPMGDFKTCEIPLKPRILPKSEKPMEPKERDKFEQHIRFLDLRIFVEKGPLGYNWLMFSIVLGKIPENNPVIVKCKLYVEKDQEKDKSHLLTEQHLVFDKRTEISFKNSFKDKVSNRYRIVSEPVIIWGELIDEDKHFMHTRKVKVPEKREEKDLHFRLELKLSDGEYACDTRHGECELKIHDGDIKVFKDMEFVCKDDEFVDLDVYSEDRIIKTHKAILASRCKVLADILEEKPDLKSLKIHIEPKNLELFVYYIYTGKLPKYFYENMIPKRKINLMSAAEYYKMECLKVLLSECKPSVA